MSEFYNGTPNVPEEPSDPGQEHNTPGEAGPGYEQGGQERPEQASGGYYQYQPPRAGMPQGGWGGYGPQGYRPPYQQGGWTGAYNGYGAPVPPQPPKPAEKDNWNFQSYDHLDARKNGGKKKHRGLKTAGAVLCCVLALAVIGFAGFGVYQLMGTALIPEDGAQSSQPGNSVGENNMQNGAGEAPGLTLADKPDGQSPDLPEGELTTPEIAKKVAPSVVGIVQYRSNQLASTGEGSGIILTSDGYIVTNAHVISGADSIKVVLSNGDNYEGRLIGSDPKTDLAVIKIEAENLTYAELGDSSAMEVGERVIAIGNPGGLTLAGSVTQGIVSAVDRPVRVTDGYTMNFLQIDAAINPGNSGGALVNAYGQVIGINSQKIAATDYEGIGFAIPTAEAKPIIDDIIAHGRVTGRVKLGITAYAIDEYASRMSGLPSGIRVGSTESGSDIAAKGIVPGDIITAINGEPVASFSDVADALKSFKPGDVVTLDVTRLTSANTRLQSFQVQVVLMEDTGETAPVPQYNN